jgi:hypothetical protein
MTRVSLSQRDRNPWVPHSTTIVSSKPEVAILFVDGLFATVVPATRSLKGNLYDRDAPERRVVFVKSFSRYGTIIVGSD